MKKKLLLMATALCVMAFATGCSSETYSKYVKLGDYKGLEIEMVKSEITDESVQEEIEMILEEYTDYTEIDGAAKEGDLVNIDFVGTIGGEEFDGGSAEDFELELGSGYFMEEFETQMVGAKKSDTKEITVTFPDDYDEDLAGKEAVFAVTVNSVSEKNAPEYNDEFVLNTYGYETVAEFEANLKEELLASAQEDNRYAAGSDALQLAVSNATIDGYPQELYDECKKEYDELNQQYAEMFGIDVADLELNEEETKSEIEDMVNEKMVSITIAEKEKLEITDKEYQEYLDNNYEIYGFEDIDTFEESYTKEAIMDLALSEKVMDFLVDNAKITEISEEEYYNNFEGEDSDFIDVEDLSDEGIDLSDDSVDLSDDEDAEVDTDAAESESADDTQAESESEANSETAE